MMIINILIILVGILLFGILVLGHEFGHFITARLCGVRVNEFAIGMGPRLARWKQGETEYSVRLFPIGGFCAMEGEEDTSDDPRSFAKRPCWMRLIILAAGAVMNFLMGLLLLLVLCLQGTGFATNTIDSLYDGFEATVVQMENGLAPGDQILAIDGERVYQNLDITLLLGRGQDTFYDLEIRRDGKTMLLEQVPLSPKEYMVDGEPVTMYGILFQVEEKTITTVLKNTWLTAIDYIRLVRMSLFDLIGGNAGVQDLMGPVGIVDTMNSVASTAQSGWQILLFLLNFGGLIAVNLAVMNLLPLPALDGGRIFFTLIELVARRPVPARYESVVHLVGFVLLMGLMVIVCYNDIARIVMRTMGGG